MARLPQPGGDANDWGFILNDYLNVSLNADGTVQQQAIIQAGGYSKPTSGIPGTDLAASVQTALAAASSAVQLGGDIGGTSTSPSVLKISGVTVSGTPSTGNVLTATSSNAASWQADQGANQHAVAVKSSSYTLTTNDEAILANASLLSVTMTLPTAVGNKNMYFVKKTDASANTVTIAGTNGQTIDGGNSAVLKIQYASICLVSDGSNWYIL